MRKYQIWKSDNHYGISEFGKRKVEFATLKDFSIKFDKIDIIETENAEKPTFKEFLKPIYISHGVHPIYNFKGEQCEQIVNVPTRILTSQEILDYLNAYTILPQETPPWEEIIYKLSCYSEVLTDEYYDRFRRPFKGSISDLAAMFLNSDDDEDEHYFVSAPKSFEERKGSIFHLPKPNRAHRRWIILSEFYDFKKNAWISADQITKRNKDRIPLIDKAKKITAATIEKAKQDYFASGGTITKIDTSLDWMKLEIHELANLIPHPSKEQRESLKEDIRLNGCLEAIILYEGKILDGRTRQGICIELGIKPKYKQYEFKISPRAFVMAMGVYRRHLNSSQIAAIGVKELLPEYEAEAHQRMQENAKRLNGNTNVVQMPPSTNGKSSELVAKCLNISAKYIRDAKKISLEHPEFFQRILDGDLTITGAKSQITKLGKIRKSPKTKSGKFEKYYKAMLDLVHSKLNQKLLPSSLSQEIDSALMSLLSIYLSFNKRNEKKLLKQLEQLKIEYPNAFSEKNEPHLKLLRM